MIKRILFEDKDKVSEEDEDEGEGEEDGGCPSTVYAYAWVYSTRANSRTHNASRLCGPAASACLAFTIQFIYQR